MLTKLAGRRYAFDFRTDDVYFCTADCGWITGHSYLTYGPLLCGAHRILPAQLRRSAEGPKAADAPSWPPGTHRRMMRTMRSLPGTITQLAPRRLQLPPSCPWRALSACLVLFCAQPAPFVLCVVAVSFPSPALVFCVVMEGTGLSKCA